MKQGFIGIWLLLASLCSVEVLGQVQPPAPVGSDISAPEALAEWRDWLLWRNDPTGCPFVAGVSRSGRFESCRWPKTLTLNIHDKAAHFSQQWQLYSQTELPLPGDNHHWPEQVQVNGVPALVIAKKGRPVLLLEAGHYHVSGMIAYARMPQALSIPPYTGALALSVKGQPRYSVAFDRQGKLLLGAPRDKTVKVDDSLTVTVFRKLSDGYPMRLETRLQLVVAGKERRVTLGRLLPEGFAPLALTSSVPARVRPDGQVDLQLRPGEQQVVLQARALNSEGTLAMQAQSPDWPRQELWSFSPNPSYRIVTLSGARSIDPSQTLLPKAWQQLNTYLVEPDSPLQLTEKQRGEAEPPKHQLRLERDLWLAFSGEELISREQLTGQVGHLDRFNADRGYQAGSLKINGAPQLITAIELQAGVEVRPGGIELTSVGSLGPQTFKINPWQLDLEKAALRLQLPPGFRLFYAAGADYASDAYLSSWDLWSIFISTIFIVLLYRLFSWQAACAGALYVLVMHGVDGGVSLPWLLLVLGCYAGKQYLPEGRLQLLIKWGYSSCLLVAAVWFLGFAVNQARQAIYPQLERPWQQMNQPSRRAQPMASVVSEKVLATSRDALSEGRSKQSAPRTQEYSYQYQPESAVQTGPGIPSWSWHSVRLSWSGPVAATQELSLWLMPPWLNRTLNLMRIFAFLWLASFLCGLKLSWPKRAQTLPASALLALMVSAVPASSVEAKTVAPRLSEPPLERPAASNWPTPELLESYRQRLLAPPICAPECHGIHSLELILGDHQIELQLSVSQQALGGVPLPVEPKFKAALRIQNQDGEVLAVRQIGQQLYTVLTPGNHRLQIVLNVSDRAQLLLPFAQPPHRVQVVGDGWQVAGVRDQRLQGRSISLQRESILAQTASESIQPLPVPPFVEIERELQLGLEWQLVTRVRRMAPVQGPVRLRIPLLAGEAVTSNQVAVHDQQVEVVLAANQAQISWRSRLPIDTQLQWQAASGQPWVERWIVRPGLRWHFEYQGLQPIKRGAAAKPALNASRDGALEWWPHAGDKLQMAITRPEPLPGEQLTIDSMLMEFKPGRRISESALTLSARTSQGREWPLALPEGATLNELILNGQPQSVSRQNGQLLIPLRPGENSLRVAWSTAEGYATQLHSPVLSTGAAANVAVQIKMPSERWILLVGGPAMGPAILFWGVLLVVILGALVLGRVPGSPLNGGQWALLGVGVASAELSLLLLILAWFALIGARRYWVNTPWVQQSRGRYNTLQLLIMLLTPVMLLSLLASVAMGLVFSEPAMQIVGNGSNAFSLNWYQDQIAQALPEAWVISVPMMVYRVLILAWSIWLSFALIRWLRWGWLQLSEGGLWQAPEPGAKTPPPADSVTRALDHTDKSNAEAKVPPV